MINFRGGRGGRGRGGLISQYIRGGPPTCIIWALRRAKWAKTLQTVILRIRGELFRVSADKVATAPLSLSNYPQTERDIATSRGLGLPPKGVSFDTTPRSAEASNTPTGEIPEPAAVGTPTIDSQEYVIQRIVGNHTGDDDQTLYRIR